MRLLSLYAQNFKKLKLGKPLELPNGIVLITGLNESGKSTILDAILYALFGRMMRPSQLPSNNEIISYGSGEAQVRLDFEVGNKKYRVVREVHKTRPNRALLYEVISEGKTKTIATTVRDTTSEIEQLLGQITYNEIVASNVVAQKDLERLIKQRSDDRRKVINVFLNLDSFNRVQDVLNDERIRIEGTNRTPGQLTLERERLKTLQEQLKEYNDCKVELASAQDKIENLRTEQSKLDNDLGDIDNLYKNLNEYNESLKQQDFFKQEIQTKTILANDFERQLANIDHHKTELEKAINQIRHFQDLSQVAAILGETSKSFEELQGFEFQKTSLEEREQRVRQQIKETNVQIGTVDRARVEFSEKPRRTWTYLVSTGALGAATILSFFFSIAFPATVALGSLTVVFLLLLARQIATLSANAQISEKRQEQLASVRILESLNKQLSDLQSSHASTTSKIQEQSRTLLDALRMIPRYNTILDASSDPKGALDQLTSAYNRDKQSLVALEERALVLQRAVQEETGLRERLGETRDEINHDNEKLSAAELPSLPEGTIFSIELLNEAADRRDVLRDSVSRVKTQLEDTTIQLIELRKYLEENKGLNEQVEDQKKKVGLLERELAIVKYSIKGLENTSESLRNRVKPQVERYMGLILPVITSGHYKAVQLDEDYTVRVFDPEAGEFKPKEVFSGGTEDQLLLAMRLAFALSLTPQAKGRSPEFLFLDEPLGSSDKVRREGIVQLIRQELLQSFKQIFLISHVGDLEVEADTVITMENGTVRDIMSRKPSLPEPVELPA